MELGAEHILSRTQNLFLGETRLASQTLLAQLTIAHWSSVTSMLSKQCQDCLQAVPLILFLQLPGMSPKVEYATLAKYGCHHRSRSSGQSAERPCRTNLHKLQMRHARLHSSQMRKTGAGTPARSWASRRFLPADAENQPTSVPRCAIRENPPAPFRSGDGATPTVGAETRTRRTGRFFNPGLGARYLSPCLLRWKHS